MPHIIVEYSSNLSVDIQPMLKDLHTSIDGKYNVALERVKTRAHKLENYIVGNEGPYGTMVHIELKLAPGRSDDAKKELAEILKATALKHLPDSALKLTVEVSELHGPSYQA